MNIVLIPCWKRDDFLSVTLDHIQRAEGADQHIYVFLMERMFTVGCLDIASRFPLKKIIHRTPHHNYQGNTFNVLEGYKLATKLADEHKSELIYLIEEDIFVGQDFFTFHENVQRQFDGFMVSAVRNQNDSRELPDDPTKVYYFSKYQSLGVSWKPQNLAPVIAHANHTYYGRRTPYLAQQFPKSTYGTGWNEQDGLINRVMEAQNLQALYPCVARAYHAGFVGYNRPGFYLHGTLDQRVDRLKKMSEAEMNALAREMKDIKQTPLTDYGVREFSLFQD